MRHHLSRRETLALAGAALAVPALAAESRVALRDAAARAGLLYGAAISRDALDDPAYGALYVRETQIVTAENDLKFDYLRPDRQTFNFATADRLVAFATANRLQFRANALIWNDNMPAWVARLSARECEAVMDEHIDRVVGRYAGRVQSWDVVNEPFWPGHGLPGGFRKGPWYAAMGPGYVARAFRRVAQADPATRLVLNEAQTESNDALGLAVRADLLRLVDDLQDAGVPLHAVGIESHLQPTRRFDAGSFAAFLAALAQRGLAIYVSELDVDDHSFPDEIARRDELVADAYARYLATVLAEPAVRVVETWGLSDARSWYQSPEVMAALHSTRAARPLPFDANFARKPAAAALADAFARRAAARDSGAMSEHGGQRAPK